jgi:hypothetical protein
MSAMKEHLITKSVEASVVLMNQGLRFHIYDIQQAINSSESLSNDFTTDAWKSYDSLYDLTAQIVEGNF